MWSMNPNRMTEKQREDDIRRLESVRDKLLASAPKHFYFRRALLPLMLLLILMSAADAVLKHHAQMTFWHGLILAAFLLFLGHSTWKVWRSTPTDSWGFSDGLGYEGDSPRDIQKKIDALRGAGRRASPE
jgi:hypothetical protein